MHPSLKYGLLAAAATSGWFLLAFGLGLHTSANYGAQIILILALWRSLRIQVQRDGRYWLPVWLGLLHGLFTALVAGLGVYCFLAVYLNFINRDYPDIYLEWLVARMRAAGEAEEQVRLVARSYRWSTSPLGLPLTLLGMYLLFGFIASPLLTLWLNWRRKERVQAG